MPRVWDLESGELTQTLEEHMCRVYSVAISPNGRIVVSGSYDGTVRWDTGLCGTSDCAWCVMHCGVVGLCCGSR